jgi:hypothetical protein
MTTRFRSRWLALFGAAALISLSMSAALGAKPTGENRGQQVSTFVHSLQGEAEEPVEEEPAEEEPAEEEPVEEEDGSPSDHGQCVAAVAQDHEIVGPPNDNHGGAVSEAARVTCRDDEASDESEGAESEESEASDSGSEHGNGHGHGHGGDSSKD